MPAGKIELNFELPKEIVTKTHHESYDAYAKHIARAVVSVT